MKDYEPMNKSLSSSFFLFLISDKGSKLSNFSVDFFVEVEPVFFTASDLKKVVVKGFFGDSDFIGGLLKGPLDVIAILIMKAGVEFSPEGYFFDNFTNFFLFLFVVFIIFSLVVLDFLFLKKGLNYQFLFVSDLDI
jgi:hypothetical protein